MRGIIQKVSYKMYDWLKSKKEYGALIIVGIILIYLASLKGCSPGAHLSTGIKTELDSIKSQKKQLPKLQEKEQELKAEIKVLTPKREKEKRKFETLKQDSVPCPQLVNQCDTVIKYDQELISALNNVIQIDSSIISLQNNIISNQDIAIESQANEITALKKKVRKHKFQKFLVIASGIIMAGVLLSK